MFVVSAFPSVSSFEVPQRGKAFAECQCNTASPDLKLKSWNSLGALSSKCSTILTPMFSSRIAGSDLQASSCESFEFLAAAAESRKTSNSGKSDTATSLERVHLAL